MSEEGGSGFTVAQIAGLILAAVALLFAITYGYKAITTPANRVLDFTAGDALCKETQLTESQMIKQMFQEVAKDPAKVKRYYEIQYKETCKFPSIPELEAKFPASS